MQKNWTERNVDLTKLTAHLGGFFKEKDFEAVKGERPTGHQILATDSPYFKINGYVSVTIEGKPNNFVVNLELCSKDKSSPFIPNFLTSMLGGGYFILRQLKSTEVWMKFEKEFWKYVDNAVLCLTNSTKSS